MVKGIIFDADGTLLDSMMIWKDAGRLYLESLGYKVKENLEEIMFDMTMAEGAEYMKKNYGLKLMEDEIIHGVNSRVYDFYAEDVEPKTGVKEFLEYVYFKDIPMTIATSTDRLMIEAALKRTGFDKYIKKIFTTTEVGKGKSNPDIFIAAMKEMKSSADETWLFEDAAYSMETAKKIGLHTVGIYDFSSMNHQEEVKGLSDIYIKNWKQYPYVIEKMNI
ncbi:MAG: HAD family hydrolase [Eubacterium sp.]